MAENGYDSEDRAVFVFDPDASYAFVDQIRGAGHMPTRGLRYVASVTGSQAKIFKVMTFEGLLDVVQRLDEPGDPETATTFRPAAVRKSQYRTFTAIVRIQTMVPDPSDLIEQIGDAIGRDSDGGVEADVVTGGFDILACVVDDDERELIKKVMKIREIDGVTDTKTLRVHDYVSTSPNAVGDFHVEPAP